MRTTPARSSATATAQTLAGLWAAGTVAAASLALGEDLRGLRALAAAVLVLFSAGGTVALFVLATRLTRPVLGGLLLSGGVSIGVAQLVPVTPGAALAVAALNCLVVVEVRYFFPWTWARRRLPALVLLANCLLLLRGDVSVATVLALDSVLLGLGIVTGQLSDRALGSRRDPLTGLPNRRSTDDRPQELVAAGGVFSVALLDLDHFKEINDTAGHEAGDRVLLRVASVPTRALPPGAVLGRQGGDEFVLLLPGRTGEQSVTDVWRICDALVGIGLSCGVAQHEAGDSVSQLMRRADGALYAAKSAGRGRVELAVGQPA